MSFTLLHTATQFIVGASLVATAAFGPPHIKVTQISDRDNAPAGAVFKVTTQHHTELEDMAVTGRAEGTRNGQRVSLPIALVKAATGQYTVTKQWETGLPWVLVFTIEQGPRGEHGVAEAMVKVNAQGTILSIDHPAPTWLSKELGAKRITPKEIDAALATIVARR